jgi:hypothetical protein
MASSGMSTGLALATFAPVGFLFNDGQFDGVTPMTATGARDWLIVPFDCTITEVTLLGQGTGSCVADFWVCSYANFDGGATHPVQGDSITASAPPTISGGYKYQDSALTGWTTVLVAGTVLCFALRSISGFTGLNASLQMQRTLV